jgi:hypothetical protein
MAAARKSPALQAAMIDEATKAEKQLVRSLTAIPQLG